MVAGVETTLGGDAADGLDGFLDGDGDEAFGGGFGARGVHLVGERLDGGPGCSDVKRLVGVEAEDMGEGGRIDPPQNNIGVRHRRRSALAVAGRPGIGARALRSHPRPQAIEVEDRAAPRRHSLDVQRRRPDPRAGDAGLVLAFKFAGVAADVGRGSAHVEAQHGLGARRFGGLGDADGAACRA